MPKGTKRKREDEDKPDPPPRQSGRQRKKRSFGVEFEEEWNPPRRQRTPPLSNPRPQGTGLGPPLPLIHCQKRIQHQEQRIRLPGLPMKNIGNNFYRQIIVSTSILLIRG